MSVVATIIINKKLFFDNIRPFFGGKLSAGQVKGMEAILDEWNARQLKDTRWLAYMLATVYHETGHAMMPVEENGKGAGHDYGHKLKLSRKPYTTPDKIYYGRGDVQLTWYENYEAMGKLLKVDLLNNPELALQVDISVKIMFEGMIRGMFTGKKLSDYFSDSKESWIDARRIINGVDLATTIAGYAKVFLTALN